VADRERVEEEGNWITRWMIRFPSEDRRGGDPLGLGFGCGECNCDPLGFGSVVAEVSDGGAVTEIFKLMMPLPWGGAEALSCLVPTPPLAGKGVTLTCQP
jgi:hypothetical protein